MRNKKLKRNECLKHFRLRRCFIYELFGSKVNVMLCTLLVLYLEFFCEIVVNSNDEYREMEFRLNTYDPSLYPVLKSYSNRSKLMIALITGQSEPIGEGKHILYDGIVGSAFLELVLIYHVNGINDLKQLQRVQMWIVDYVRVEDSLNLRKDEFFISILQFASIPVLVIDFHDDPKPISSKHLPLANPNLRYAKRSIVEGRNIKKNGSPRLGYIKKNYGTTGGPTIHIPYCVRNDIVGEVFHQRGLNTSIHFGTIDVCHFWNANDTAYFSTYRSKVSLLIDSLDNKVFVRGRPISTTTNIKGLNAHAGRWTADPKYVAALLRCKIAVVTQRDRWEDSYRLMEAMAAGVMVISDRMLAPPKGIIDGIHIRYFSSISELKMLIIHYLLNGEERTMVAKAGHTLVMSQHRSWHRMEELIFGAPLTKRSSSIFPPQRLD
jgi:glycosyltransferase involved in cell wall biosynthesis